MSTTTRTIIISTVLIAAVGIGAYLYLRRNIIKVLGAEINVVQFNEPPDQTIMEGVEE